MSNHTDPALIASTDQTIAEFAGIGIDIRPNSPTLAILAIDAQGHGLMTARPGIVMRDLAAALRAAADRIEEGGD